MTARLEMEMGNGLKFSIAASQVGLSDERAQALLAGKQINHSTAMIWSLVRTQGEILLCCDPWGSA